MSKDRYLDEFPGEQGIESSPGAYTGKVPPKTGTTERSQPAENRLLSFWASLSNAGLGEMTFRLGTQILSVAVLLAAVWAMRAFYLYAAANPKDAPAQAALAAPLDAATLQETDSPEEVALPPMDMSLDIFDLGIPRLAVWHTIIPTRPRTEVVTYTVETGDTLFGIAEKFGLKPETLLWGNAYTLGDDPHRLRPDQKLNILPVNGVYHKWSAGEGLNGVASFYGVTPEDIINWPGNHLNAATIGDFSAPEIEPGTMLVVPGGSRPFVSWSGTFFRDNPAQAKIFGPGACGEITTGLVGTGAFIWPAANHWLSGYDYSPDTNHFGIDIGGQTGLAIFAADGGVVVYAGWNNWGYGNVVAVDHGTGWQTLYAHLSAINVSCGQSVTQGTVIGAMGSTGNSSGPHLHFEIIGQSYGRVNPWDFLPPP